MFVSKDPETGRVFVGLDEAPLIFRDGVWAWDVPTADDFKDNFERVRDSKEADIWVQRARAELSSNRALRKEISQAV